MNMIEIVKQNKMIQLLILVVVVFVVYKYVIASKEGLEPVSNELPSVMKTQFGQQDTTIDTSLLPSYENVNEFDKENQVSNILNERKLLIAGKHSGIDTVVQSNKIVYNDIRSAPPIVKQDVGPFLNSSYESPVGAGRKQFVIA